MSPKIRISDDLKEKLDDMPGHNYNERIHQYIKQQSEEKANERVDKILTERDVVRIIERNVVDGALV